MSTRVKSLFPPVLAVRSLAVLAAASLLACHDQPRCRIDGAMRWGDVCICPADTRYVRDAGGANGRCESEPLDASDIVSTMVREGTSADSSLLVDGGPSSPPCTGACAAPACGDGIQNQPTEECDDGNNVDQDDCLNSCRIARCGDGVVNSLGGVQRREECERPTAGASAWKCSAMCMRTTFYATCADDSDCSLGEVCLGTCTAFCDLSRQGVFGPGSGCPAAVGATRELCEPSMTPSCRITGCASDADCPEQQRCFQYHGASAAQIYTSVCLRSS